MSRVLIATWDGAGNLVPTLAIAQRLARAGHDVRLLGHRSIARRCGGGGWRLRPFAHTIDLDSAADPAGGIQGLALARALWFNASVATDVREELAREAADVVIADCMLFGALSAGQASGTATVSLFHGAFGLFRGGPFVELVSSLMPELNALRADLGLSAVQRIGDVHDACALSLVATPREFEPPVPIPANVRFIGPLLDGPPLAARDAQVARRADGRPEILVSLSTSDQGQLPVLQRLVDALSTIDARTIVTTGPAIDPSDLRSRDGIEVARFVPHRELLPRASLVITHAGLGTVMTSLAYGVPLLCMPFGRDQFFNAARVAALGVGQRVPLDASDVTLADAARRLLDDVRMREAAARFSQVIKAYRNGAAAVEEIEHLARRSTAGTRHSAVG